MGIETILGFTSTQPRWAYPEGAGSELVSHVDPDRRMKISFGWFMHEQRTLTEVAQKW